MYNLMRTIKNRIAISASTSLTTLELCKKKYVQKSHGARQTYADYPTGFYCNCATGET